MNYDVALAIAAHATYQGNFRLARLATDEARRIHLPRQVREDATDPIPLVADYDILKSIGHIGLQGWAMQAQRGWTAPQQRRIALADTRIANPYLAKLVLDPVNSSRIFKSRRDWYRCLNPLLSPLPELTAHVYDSISSLIHRDELRALEMPHQGANEAIAYLRSIGWEQDSPFVGLHLRTPSRFTEPSRDVNPVDYSGAVEHLLANDLKVLHIGHIPIGDVTNKPGYLNLTRRAYPSVMDAFAFSACQFFLGTVSGPYMYPPLFGKPCLVTNHSSFGFNIDFPKTVHLPKHVRRTHNGTFMTDTEALSRHLYFGDARLSSGFEFVNNSPSELLDAAQWMTKNYNSLDATSQIHVQLDHEQNAWSYRAPHITPLW